MQYRIDASLDVANCMQLSSVLSTSADPADDVITERIELGIDHRLADLEAWHHVHVERRISPTEPHGLGLCDHRSRRSAGLPRTPCARTAVDRMRRDRGCTSRTQRGANLRWLARPERTEIGPGAVHVRER